jgi:dipeptidyl aminopeptidase/acylaminoacyl peptidase
VGRNYAPGVAGRGPTWWVGVDETGGIPNPGRPDVKPPEHWRLAMVAATHRVRQCEVSPDGATVAYMTDSDCSDVWTVPVAGGTPSRITTGRRLAAFWEDGNAVWSPDGTRLAFTADGKVHVVSAAGGVPIEVCEGSSPVWLDGDMLVVGVDRDDATALARVTVGDAWPARLAVHGGDCISPVVSPDGSLLAHLVFHHDDLNCTSLHVVDLADGSSRELVHDASMNVRAPAFTPDGTQVLYATERSGWYELESVDLATGARRVVTRDGGDLDAMQATADGHVVATRARRGATDLVRVSLADGTVEVLAAGGTWSSPRLLPDGDVIAVQESFTQPARLCRVGADGAVRTLVDHTPAPVRAAPHVVPEHVTYRSTDGMDVHGWLYRPTTASADAPCPAVVQPHGGPTSLTGDEWDGVAQWFVARGYAWFAINFRGSTTYGRDFERANHGVWGVDDTGDCLAAHDHLASLGWVDATRIAIFGASYGSYLALTSAVDDPQHRFAAAVMKYGDCDILTSWAQGDIVGRLDLERMMGHPRAARAAYGAGSPIHRIEQLTVPVLVAHGELDERVSLAQAEELVAALRRLDKQFEYVTYPTEGHGLLRTEPFVHFHERLARFLDWHLMP